MRHAIADHLGAEQKDAALAHAYAPINPGAVRRDADGYCPLGRAIGGSVRGARSVRAPCSDEVALALGWDPWGPGRLAAKAFIDGWDGGEIADLAEALGMGDKR